ncbi:hypothetical protein AND_005693 [Anopheles darlingi]|uniref:Uncharacterized protein n=1 Tax=Anopheles darlingi TaxID=43151 RepID=W5JEV1_ANODA|nr:hypothetical protein AND_005693 [Anopheles darlingi]
MAPYRCFTLMIVAVALSVIVLSDALTIQELRQQIIKQRFAERFGTTTTTAATTTTSNATTANETTTTSNATTTGATSTNTSSSSNTTTTEPSLVDQYRDQVRQEAIQKALEKALARAASNWIEGEHFYADEPRHRANDWSNTQVITVRQGLVTDVTQLLRAMTLMTMTTTTKTA